MQTKLLTGWQCNCFILQEKGIFNRSFNIMQATLKNWVQHIKTIPRNLLLSASSCESGFRDLAFNSKSFLKLSICHMRGRAGSVTEILVSGLEILPYEHFIPVTGMNGGMNSGGPDGIVLHCLLYFPYHKHPINCSDTALRVTEAMMGPKVRFFVFRYVRLVSPICRQNSSPGSLAFAHLCRNFSHEAKAKFSPVNHAHVKRPLL